MWGCPVKGHTCRRGLEAMATCSAEALNPLPLAHTLHAHPAFAGASKLMFQFLEALRA